MSPSTRRHFLKSTATAGLLGFFPGHGYRTAAASSPNERPAFATIGLRNQGWAITNKTLRFADFVALADVDSNVLGTVVENCARKQSHRPAGYKDYRKILDRKDIDAVMIATPDHWHTKIAVEAMLAGKDVYCEKPLTLTIDEGKLIERTVEKTGRVLQVGTMQRTEYNNRFITAVAMIRAGRIGTVKKITCGLTGLSGSPALPAADTPAGLDWDFWLGPAKKVPYRALPELREGYGGGVPLYSNCHYAFHNWHDYAGGKLTNWGSHHVDIACWALGIDKAGPRLVRPLKFTMAVEHRDGYPVVDDRYNAATSFQLAVSMPDDVQMIITSGGDRGVLFEGSEGRFFVNRGKLVGRPVEDLGADPLPDGAIEEVYGGPVSENHSANFIEAMRSRRQPISDVWSHNRTLEICHLSNIAMRLGRELRWDPQQRQIVGDEQANGFLARSSRKEYEIEM
jgi:predicted dehydrogenase